MLINSLMRENLHKDQALKGIHQHITYGHYLNDKYHWGILVNINEKLRLPKTQQDNP